VPQSAGIALGPNDAIRIISEPKLLHRFNRTDAPTRVRTGSFMGRLPRN
jgi:uncharacterized protein YjiK